MSFLDWKVGDRVVCVDASGTNLCGIDELEEGKVYTIAWIGSYPHAILGEFVGVRLEGVSRPGLTEEECAWFAAFGESPFGPNRFRPVQTRKTDISIFTALLNTQDELIEVPFA